MKLGLSSELSKLSYEFKLDLFQFYCVVLIFCFFLHLCILFDFTTLISKIATLF